jgi:hypothetical protein
MSRKEEALKEERSRRGQEGGREPRVCDSPEGRYPLDSRVVARRQGLVELLEGWWSLEQHE